MNSRVQHFAHKVARGDEDALFPLYEALCDIDVVEMERGRRQLAMEFALREREGYFGGRNRKFHLGWLPVAGVRTDPCNMMHGTMCGRWVENRRSYPVVRWAPGDELPPLERFCSRCLRIGHRRRRQILAGRESGELMKETIQEQWRWYKRRNEKWRSAWDVGRWFEGSSGTAA